MTPIMTRLAQGLQLALLCALLPIWLHAAGQSATRKAGDVVFEPLILKADGGDIPGELGRLTVPENRRKPGSRPIDIAFARFKSTAANPGAPIVMLAGGPGGPGIPNLASPGRQPTLRALLQVSDVVFWDQRGVGRSTPPTECEQTWDFALESVRTRQSFVNDARRLSKACAEDLVAQGTDLAAYDSYASADDLLDLATALKVNRIMTYGGSYGSHLTLAAIRRHEKLILRSVITSVEGPDDTIKLPGNEQRQLEKIAALVKKDPTMGPIVPDLVGLMKSVFDKLEAAPATTTVPDPKTKQPVKVTISKFDVQMAVAATLGNVQALRKLPGAVYDMSKGEFSWPAAWVLSLHGSSIGSGMAMQMDCASGLSDGRRARIKKEAAGTLLGDVTDLPFPDVCDAWVPNDLGPAFRGPLTSGVPALFVTGDIDGRTPTSNADLVRKGFTRQHRIEVENAAHGGYQNDPKVLEAMVEFLRTGTMPALTRGALPALVFDKPATLTGPDTTR
jgi:pimeloyl-ACP methyl ester carboxylesterase